MKNNNFLLFCPRKQSIFVFKGRIEISIWYKFQLVHTYSNYWAESNESNSESICVGMCKQSAEQVIQLQPLTSQLQSIWLPICIYVEKRPSFKKR